MAGTEVPKTTDEALMRVGELRPPVKIRVLHEGSIPKWSDTILIDILNLNINCCISCPEKQNLQCPRRCFRRSHQTLGVLRSPRPMAKCRDICDRHPDETCEQHMARCIKAGMAKATRPGLVLAGAGERTIFSQPQPENTGELWKRIC